MAQVAWGLSDPDWEGCSRKERKKLKRERIDLARKELQKHAEDHNLPIGSLLGGEGAGAAPSALSAGGQPAGLVVDRHRHHHRHHGVPRVPRLAPRISSGGDRGYGYVSPSRKGC